jgi:hypothetical protein
MKDREFLSAVQAATGLPDRKEAERWVPPDVVALLEAA